MTETRQSTITAGGTTDSATDQPVVTISGPTVVATTGVIQLIAAGNPPNGTCKWTASDSSVTLLPNGCTVAVSASGSTSGAASVVTVTYTQGEIVGTASQTETVILPSSCPTMISVNQIDPEALSTQFPSLETGIGIVAEMLATGPNVPYTGPIVFETVTLQSNGCAKYDLANTCVPSGGGNFTIGAGGQGHDGVYRPGKKDVFYDEHGVISRGPQLSSGQSCSIVCKQQYYCGGLSVGPMFTITEQLQAGTISGVLVTNVTATKQ